MWPKTLRVSLPELEESLESGGDGAQWLLTKYTGRPFADLSVGASKVLWDTVLVGYLRNPDWYTWKDIPKPMISGALEWEAGNGRGVMREVLEVHRDSVIKDMFSLLNPAED